MYWIIKNVIIFIIIFFKKQTLWPLFVYGVQLSQGYSHYDESVYFLPLTLQTLRVEYTWSVCKEDARSPSIRLIGVGRVKGWVDLGESIPVVLNPGPLDWQSGALTSRPYLQILGSLSIFYLCVIQFFANPFLLSI